MIALGAVDACHGGASASPAYVQQYCSLLAPCCPSNEVTPSTQPCEQALEGESYDAAAGQACLSAMQAEQHAGTLCATLGGDIPECGQAFTPAAGTTPPGHNCEQDSDCAPAAGGSAVCYDAQLSAGEGGISSTGTCVQISAGQVGATPCIGDADGSTTSYSWTGTGALPKQAYVCNGATCGVTTQTCVALEADGQPCIEASDCIPADYCAATSSDQTACAPRLADGSNCVATPYACLTTSSCNASSVCAPLVAIGAACQSSSDCQSGRCVGGKCTTANAGLVCLLFGE